MARPNPNAGRFAKVTLCQNLAIGCCDGTNAFNSASRSEVVNVLNKVTGTESFVHLAYVCEPTIVFPNNDIIKMKEGS